MTNSPDLHRTHDIGKKSLSGLHSKKLRMLVEYWNKLRGDKTFPSRQDFSPEDVQWMLGDLSIVDVLPEPRRYRYRLFGSNVAEHIGANLQGKQLDEFNDPRAVELITQSYDQVLDTSAPLAIERHEYLQHLQLNYESVVLPFSRRDGQLDMLLVGCDFKPFDEGEYQVVKSQEISEAGECDDGELRPLFEMWSQQKVGQYLPSDEFLDPFRLKRWLGNLVVFQVNKSEPKFVYRLVGTNIVSVMGHDLTGKSIDDHPIKAMASSYRKGLELCVAKRCALYAKVFRPVDSSEMAQDFIASKLLVLPLVSRDGEVSKILAGQMFNLSKGFIS